MKKTGCSNVRTPRLLWRAHLRTGLRASLRSHGIVEVSPKEDPRQRDSVDAPVLNDVALRRFALAHERHEDEMVCVKECQLMAGDKMAKIVAAEEGHECYSIYAPKERACGT
jgi:hypothetical protein